MGGVCWYGEVYWNANLSSYLLFRGSLQGTPHPSVRPCCTRVWPHSFQEMLGHPSILTTSHLGIRWILLLGFVVALMSFVGFKLTLEEFFSFFFFGGPTAWNFWTRQCSRGGYRNGDQSTASHTNSSLGPPLSLSALFSIEQQTTRFCSRWFLIFKTLQSRTI